MTVDPTMFRLVVLRQRLKLELAGMRHSGGSTFTIVKKEFNLKGTRQRVYEQFCKIVTEVTHG